MATMLHFVIARTEPALTSELLCPYLILPYPLKTV